MSETPPQPSDPRGGQPILNAPPATVGLCVALVAAYFMTGVLDNHGGIESILVFDLAAFRGQFGDTGTGLSPSAMISLIGHALIHADLGHLATNTLFLLAFATPVERTLGRRFLFTVFVLSVVAGALVMAVLSSDPYALLVGASGGVHGVAGVTGLILRSRGNAAGRRIGTGLLGFLVISNAILALTDGGFGLFGFRIGWEAHAGGLAMGLICGLWALARAGRRESGI
jgi:membrane associated rhomboid family serine protease